MTEHSGSSKPEEIESCANVNVFNSTDFSSFLKGEFPGSNPFLSKDNSLPSFDLSSVFKSKDTFSQMFSSADWQMKFTKPEPAEPDLPPRKSVPAFVVAPTTGETENTKESLRAVLSSRDWMASNTLGPHVDVSINRDMILRGASSASEQSLRSTADLSTAFPPAARTDWDSMFFSEMQLMPPPDTSATQANSTDEEPAALPPIEMLSYDATALPELEEEARPMLEDLAANDSHSRGYKAQSSQTTKKKRKRKPRKKVIPEVKIYVESKQYDVLLGRGGRSNHHVGNKRYREEVKNLRSWYNSIGDNKDEKTALSQCLVDYVHGYEGRFLEKDKTGAWYEVPNIVARRKASQALREDDDPEKRAAKRARFLKRKAASGEEGSQSTS
jgi:hypothetical protein